MHTSLQGDSPATIDQGPEAGWRRPRREAALSDVHRTIPVGAGVGTMRKLAAFLGPGYLVAVGYMDPGNWATSLAGGSKFGYTLLVVSLVSNIMAIVLQSLCARLAVASGRDLAQACRDAYPRWAAWPLWVLAEVAIIATDIAEVIGTAIGLNLLFGIPLEIGVILTALDVFLILYLQRIGFRYLEALIITLLGVITACFAVQIALANPEWGPLIRGFAPTVEIVRNPDMLYLAMGILGATVMPHNLYLHSAIVQTRAWGTSLDEKREAMRYATIELDHRFDVCAAHQCVDSDPGRRDLPQDRPDRRGGTRPDARTARATAGLRHRTQPVRDRAAVLRTELDRHGNAGRTSGDGRISSISSCSHGCGAFSHAPLPSSRQPASRSSMANRKRPSC